MALSTREVFLILRARDEASRVLRGFSNNVKKLDKETIKAAQAQQMRGQALSSIGIGLIAAGAAATSYFKGAVDSAIEYTRQAAYTATQTDKVKVSIEQLKDIGREVGASIPTDFDHIQQSLYDIFSSIDTNLPQAKKLLKEFAMESVAGQEDLREAGKGTIGILNAFKIPIEKVRTVSDTMFQLVRKGVGTYQMFNRTIGRAVPSAVRAGQSFQDLAGMMAFLTRNGLSAAMASASAGRALDAFSNPKVVKRLEKMGISVRNAKGEFQPISKVVTELGKKMKGLTAPERAAALQDLFKGAGGTIQARRFYDIAVKNYDKLNQYTAQMKNSKGTLQGAYNTMFKQPQSQAVLLSNNMKILKTIVGDALTPAWLNMTGAIIKVVKWFNNLDPHTRKMIVKIAALAAGLSILIGVILTIAGVFLLFASAAAFAGTTIGAILLPIALIVAAVIAIGVAIFFVIKYHKQIWAFMKKVWGDAVVLFKKVWAEVLVLTSHIVGLAKSVGTETAKIAAAIWDKIGKPISEVGGWFKDLGGWFAKVGTDIWNGLGPPLGKIWQALQKGAQKAWDAIRPALKQFAAAMGPVLKAIIDFAVNTGKTFKRIFVWIFHHLDGFVGEIKWVGRRVMDFLRILHWVAQQIGKVLYSGVQAGIAAFKIFAAVAANVIPPVMQLVGNVIKRIINFLRGLIQFVVGVFTGDWGKAWEGIKTIVSNIFGLIADVIVGAVKIIFGLFKGLVKGIVDAAKWLWDKLVGHSIFPDIMNAIVGWFKWLLNIGPKVFKAMVSAIIALAEFVLGKVIQFAKDLLKPFAGAATWLFQKGKDFIMGLLKGIGAIAFITWIKTNVIDKAIAQFSKARDWLLDKGKDVVLGFLDGLKAQWKTVTDWIGGITTWIKDHKGPISLDRKLLTPAGVAIMQGFLKGLKAGAGPAWAFVTKVGGKSKDMLASAIGGPLGGTGGPAPTNPTGMAGLVRTLAAQRGWGEGSQWDALYQLVMHESGFRANAANPTSSAYGLFQFLDSTWGSVGASKTSDPWAQTIAGLRYIANSYGSPANAWAKWQSRSPHWYKKGTPWVPDDQLAFLHKGEAVIPANVNRNVNAARSMTAAINISGGMGKVLVTAGQQVSAGLKQGIGNGQNTVVGAVKALALATVKTTKDTLGIASPSKIFAQLGAFITQGFRKGIVGTTAQVVSAMKQLNTKIFNTAWTYIDTKKSLQKQIGNIQTQIAIQLTKPNTKANQLRVAQQRKNLAIARGDLSTLESMYAKLNTAAKRASINKLLATQNKALQGLANRRADVIKKLADAQTNLTNAIGVRADFVAGVKDSIMEYNAITNMPLEDWQTSNANSLIEGMKKTLAASQTFAKQLTALKKAGLNNDTYAQILGAGVDAGGKIATALLNGGKAAITTVNGLQSQIGSAAKSLAISAGDDMYAAGIQAARGIVAGLQSQQKALNSATVNMANAFVIALKKALGIKSPSQVMVDLFKMVPIGAAKGITDNLGVLRRATGAMSRTVQAAPSVPKNDAGPPSTMGGNQYFDFQIHTQEIDPVKHAADLGYEFARRVS